MTRAILFALGIAFASGAVAQRDDGDSPASRGDVERAMAEFARGEVKSDKGRAAALADGRETPGSPSTNAQRLIKSPCAARGTQLRLNPELFRMAVLPALYARDFGKAAPADLAAVVPVDILREFDGTPIEETVTLRNFGDCVVRGDAANSRAVVPSQLYKPEEAAAFAARQPAMGQCVPAGQQLRFSRSVVRGAIGEALYKMTGAAGAAKAG